MSSDATVTLTPRVTRVVRSGGTPPNTVVVENDKPRVIVVASPGAAGPIGPPGPAGGNVFQGTAGQILGGHRVVRGSSGDLTYASADIEEHGDDVMGVTMTASALGGTVSVFAAGEMEEPSWTWAPFEPIFLGLDGMLTQTPPIGAKFHLTIGFATSTTSMMIRIGNPTYKEV